MRTILLACTILGLAVPAMADTGSELRDFGLVGTWSPDCSMPASKKFPRVIFAVPASGAPTRTLDFGADGTVTITINSAKIVAANKLMLAETRETDESTNDAEVVLSMIGGKMVTLRANLKIVAKQTIKGGLYSDADMHPGQIVEYRSAESGVQLSFNGRILGTLPSLERCRE